MTHRSYVLLALASLAARGEAQSTEKRIKQVMDRPEFAHAIWGIEFYDLGAKKTAALSGQALGEIASIAWETIK